MISDLSHLIKYIYVYIHLQFFVTDITDIFYLVKTATILKIQTKSNIPQRFDPKTLSILYSCNLMKTIWFMY